MLKSSLRKLTVWIFAAGIVALAMLAMPRSANAAVTICNGGDSRMYVAVAREDPNLTFFGTSPFSSWGFARLDPSDCEQVSGGRSDGMSIYFYVKRWVNDEFVNVDYQAVGEVRLSRMSFCVDEENGWNLRGTAATDCYFPNTLEPFPYVLHVPFDTWDYTLWLD